MGDKALLATMAGILAQALAEQHLDDEAWELLDTVDEAAAPDDLSAQMLRRIVRAELLARGGDTAAADRLSAEAVRIAASTDWLVERADVLMARGRILRAGDREEDAVRSFAQAFELFSRKGNVVSAERAARPWRATRTARPPRATAVPRGVARAAGGPRRGSAERIHELGDPYGNSTSASA